MKRSAIALALALASAPTVSLPLYGFDGTISCFGLADCQGPREVTATFQLDPTLDLNPAPNLGHYAGTDLKITLAGVELPIISNLEIFTFNNEPGPFCNFSTAQPQGRDRISLLGTIGTGFVSAMLDTCNTTASALESGSLLGANLSAFGPFSTGPGESLVLAGSSVLPHLFFPEALGTTRAIYALPPSAQVPEPSSLLLIALALLIGHGLNLYGRATKVLA